MNSAPKCDFGKKWQRASEARTQGKVACKSSLREMAKKEKKRKEKREKNEKQDE